MTLTQFEASLVPSATPALPRGIAGQCAGAAYDCRVLIDRGLTFAAAQAAIMVHPRHLPQLAAANQADVFAQLTGP
jgi:hypothetical protein